MVIVLGLTTGLLMGLAISNIARGKGYGSTLLWFVYGFAIWPIALLHVALLPNKTKKAADDAIAQLQQRPPTELTGMLVRNDGTDERATLSHYPFRTVLTTASGARWESSVAQVTIQLRPDLLLEIAFGDDTWLFRPDEPACVATDGLAIGIQRQCPNCPGLSAANSPICALCMTPLPSLTTA